MIQKVLKQKNRMLVTHLNTEMEFKMLMSIDKPESKVLSSKSQGFLGQEHKVDNSQGEV